METDNESEGIGWVFFFGMFAGLMLGNIIWG